MVSTNDSKLYEYVRMFRSHGMVRESTSAEVRKSFETAHPDLTPEFIFAFPGYNVRSTEINAVIGRSQLGRLDANNKVRAENLGLFLDNLDPSVYWTDFEREGNSNYAFTLVLQKPDAALRDQVMDALRRYNVEFRRGTSGGGNQLRQPYLKKIVGEAAAATYPKVDHVHFFGFYIGNYPGLEKEKVHKLCTILNEIPYGSKD
jgi:CDP-6-deoxy-D-xylo-4-hexulose-3-dehydrase